MPKLKQIAYQELRRITERTERKVVRDANTGNYMEVFERVPFRLWYVAANGDMIQGEECVTIAVYPERRSRMVRFTASGQIRRIRDIAILRVDDWRIVYR